MKEAEEEKSSFDPRIWGQRRAAEACISLRVYNDLKPNDTNSILLWQALSMIGAVLSVCPKDKEDDQIQVLVRELPEIIEYFRENLKEEHGDDTTDK